MKVTIKKIAEEAGVSVTTVSNVINNRSHRVSKEKLALINSIIKKYNYTPNQNARSLVKAPSKLIGLIYYSKRHSRNIVNPFVSEILSGVEYEAKEQDYFVLFHNVQKAEDLIKIQTNWKFAGFVIVGVPSGMFKEIDQLLEVPVVYIDTVLDAPDLRTALSNPNTMFVNTEDSELEAIATRHLIEKGHKKIGFVSRGFDEQEPSVNEQRYAGYKKAMLENGLTELSKIERSQKVHFEDFLSELNELTAVVVTEDFLAIELIKFLKDHQLMLSVVGIDDIEFASLVEPPLTTIRIDHAEKGSIAINKLIANISETFAGQFTSVNGELIVRESVKDISESID
ncbi:MULTISPECIES: LacI family DNA-binding transcriptional regulator [Enterococcus]|uniref:HTH lacI-type domain-containing protein n=1 Tax=Enterococcus malodoratus ATCC 43197 TaxID=1158601 RepID=R2QUW0_9ENTE|nr:MULTISPECIES: LacI family DNA-binding transcriptional regulator [Enterococcus]EOH75280.1 hypothetical protein UAI_03082 [Enterococcus malodoratus ATCC 43197]EOT66742.1 hypothetical protein I585_02263 [Enterococcus malodoratus ATCC 43197]OJG65962.1 hypothetical protein RV07_GL001549 [Enterococcus malodoratus]SPW90764.1 LacI family transcriptional regulator [Enterococcus malodoratus]STD70005.1 LacI family transcriptional regulator [Enterococcus malodoratus]